MSDFTHADVERILRLVETSSCAEFLLETPDLRIHISRDGGRVVTASGEDAAQKPAISAPAPAASPAGKPEAAAPSEEPLEEVAAEGEVITSPMVGIFYLASAPDAPPFVTVGSVVGPEDTVCLLEVMKLFQTVPAGLAGTVRKILVANGELVEYGQPLFVIEPA